MASGAQQLVADYEQVQKLLELYPNIRIIETEGSPPERYDIEYTIKGYMANEDGTASPVNSHQIRIILPFGYPHFPPTAKPLTPIFHPDIDPDAIRIADFWQDNNSLADLILHIGQMICGNLYQKEEPFNQDAFDWYEKRQDWLPFDTLEPGDAEEHEESTESEAGASEEVSAPADKGEAKTVDAKGPSGETLDILKDDLIFPFDEDELLDETAETPAEDISALDAEKETEGLDEDISDAFDLEEASEEPATLEDFGEEEFDSAGEEEELPSSLEVDEAEEFEGVEIDDLIGIDEDETPLTFEDEEELAEDLSLDSLGGEVDDLSEDEKETPLTFEMEESGEPAAKEGAQDEGLEKIEEEDIPLDFESEEQSGTEEADTPLTMDSAEPEAIEDLEEAGELPGNDEESLAGLELGDEEPQGETDKSITGGTIRSVSPLLEQKKIYTAKKVIADIPDPDSVQGIEEFQETIAAAIKEAEELFKKADKLEQAGELEKAGLTLDLVANIAVDYPGLEFARNRIRETMIAGQGTKEEAEPSDEKPADKKPLKKKKGPKIRVKLPYKVIAIVLVLIGIVAGAATVVINDSDNMNLANTNFQTAEQLLEKKEYKQAQQALNNADSALNSILFLQKAEKDKVRKNIQAIVDSQSFKEGLQGRVLYEGKYVTVEMAKGIDKFNAQMLRGETLQNSGDIEKAIATYELAVESAKKIGFTEQETNIRHTINNLRLNQALAAARKAEEEQEWKQAADTYAKALDMSKTLSTADDKNEIATRLAAASFRHELIQGQKAFTSSEWQKTIEMLQRAQNILEANPEIASESEKNEINKLLVNSRLYHILSRAKNAFEKQEWEMAINKYQNALYFLDHNRDVLGEEVSGNINKIEKTILMTRISREQDQNALAVDKNDLETSLKSYQAIAVLIQGSPFQEDEALKKIYENAQTQTVNLEHEIKINRRLDWLSANYEEIFRKMYPSAKSSKLMKPQTTFIKEEDGRLIFKMGCVEKRQGRLFRLELNYQYDPKTDSWNIYSGKL